MRSIPIQRSPNFPRILQASPPTCHPCSRHDLDRYGWVRLALVALSLVLSLSATTSHAQVNTEALRVGDPKPGLSGTLGAGLDLKRGAVDYLELVGNGQIIYFQDIHTVLLNGSGGYGNTQGERFQSRAFGHLRWTAMWHPRLGSELFLQLEYDQFLRQQIRGLAGAGGRWRAFANETFETFFGLAYMLEREVLNIEPDNPHPRRSLNHRLTSYISLKWNPNDRVQLVQTLYVQPRLDDPIDVRMLEQADIRVAMVEQLGLKTSVTVHFDNRPPAGVPKANLALTQGVDVTW